MVGTTPTTKPCNDCGAVKPLDAYYMKTNGYLDSYCKPCSNRRRSTSNRKRRMTATNSFQILPPAPFAAWLRWVIARDETTVFALSARLGVSEKTLRVVLKEERGVELATVERALIADDTARLDDLYPLEPAA